VFFRFLPAAAEERRHLEIPASERAIGRPLLKAGIDLQDGLERILDIAAVLETLAPMFAAIQK